MGKSPEASWQHRKGATDPSKTASKKATQNGRSKQWFSINASTKRLIILPGFKELTDFLFYH